MGFWFNNFSEFERKRNRVNRLILNFYYVGDPGEEDKSVKVFVNQDIKISTNFLNEKGKEKVIGGINLEYNERKFGKFSVLDVNVPNDPKLIESLPREFQTGNYDKLFRFGGFYPERKVSLTHGLENKFNENNVLELENLSGVEFGEFLSSSEVNLLPYIIIDIEKPLWKKDEEKRYLNIKKGIEKRLKKYSPEDKLKAERIIDEINKRMTVLVDDVGEISLADSRFDSKVSVVQTSWGFPNKGENFKEVYIYDPRREVNYDRWEKFKFLKFSSEGALVSELTQKFHERKPIVSYNHNQVYDYTQLRFSAQDHKIIYDPAISDVQPRRDFVRMFLQRLKEDMIYVDTLWLSKIFYPYLSQKRFGTNHKLAGVANHLGIDFSKTQSHEDLRFLELKRLFGKTKEIRKKAADDLIYYSCDDVNVVEKMIKKMNPFHFLVEMKNLLPFSTYSEIAFSSNSINKLHEFNHFKRTGNLPYYGYKAKERQDEMQIFKKRFSSIKKKSLKWAGLKKAQKGIYENEIKEFYLPFEEFIKNFSFKLNPELKGTYEKFNGTESELAFFQYLKSYSNEILADYYFVRRDEKIYKDCLNSLGTTTKDVERVRKEFDNMELNKILGSFRYLKNHFRSIYVSLKGKKRKLITPTKLNTPDLNYPKIMELDRNLFLLRENSKEVAEGLSKFNKKNLKSFLDNFNTFDNEISLYSPFPKELVYSYIYLDRLNSGAKKFFGKYGFSHNDLKKEIAKGYKKLAREFDDKKLVFLDNIGDYLITQGEGELENCIKVRTLESFVVK